MRLQIKETAHELALMENRNPIVSNRLRFIRSLKADSITDWESQASNNGVDVEDAEQWLRLYMIGGVELLMNAQIKDPSVAGMPLSYSALSRYVPRERLNQFNVSLTSSFGALPKLDGSEQDIIGGYALPRDGKLAFAAVKDALKVLEKLPEAVSYLKGRGNDLQDKPAELLKWMRRNFGISVDRSRQPAGRTSQGDGIKGEGIIFGAKFFEVTKTATHRSWNSDKDLAYKIRLTPRQYRVMVVLHELGHKTGRHVPDNTSKEQDANTKGVIDNCIRPAIRKRII